MKERIEGLRALLREGEAIRIVDGANRFYLTGFPSSAGELIITREGAYFFIDFRYFEKARATVTAARTILLQNSEAQLRELLAREGVRRLYVESERMSIRAYDRLAAAFPNLEISREDRVDRAIAEARSIKTAEELSHIVAAQQMTDETFSYVLDRITPGRTEREIMLDMEFYMRRLGSEGVAFDFIVVSGKNSSLPHGVPTDKKIAKGDFVTMDFGAVYRGYCSDMTRTVAVGTVSEEQRRVYETVREAQRRALAFIRPGVSCRDVDRVARDHINACGYEGCFGHGLGHSLGIEVHESPACNTRCATILRPGVVMTVEPGVYLENKFGVRIEDMVYLTESGAQNLTKSEHDLLVL